MNLYRFLFFLIAGGLFASQLYPMETPDNRSESSSDSSEDTPPPVPVRTASLPPAPMPPVRTTSLPPAPVPPERTTSLPFRRSKPLPPVPKTRPYSQSLSSPQPAAYPSPDFNMQRPMSLQMEQSNEQSSTSIELTKKEEERIKRMKENINKIMENLLHILKQSGKVGTAAKDSNFGKALTSSVPLAILIGKTTPLIINVINDSNKLSKASPEVRSHACAEILKITNSPEFKRTIKEFEEYAKSDEVPSVLRTPLEELAKKIKFLPADIIKIILKK